MERRRERQKGVNHSAVVNANTQRECDGKLTEAFYIGPNKTVISGALLFIKPG